ncbi:MAG: desulfoferrodoxin [Bacteroidaceae bacterium]|nr:desulfoferrodoxin [Bacteroidaceae bacterium]
MTERTQVYRCPICGNIVEVLEAGAGTLVCCGKPMVQLVANTTDAATEKHVPVIEAIDGGYKITVGSVAHPMQDEHYIQWIELITENTVLRKYLKPGETPEAVFLTTEKVLYAREYCNLHGLWKGIE